MQFVLQNLLAFVTRLRNCYEQENSSQGESKNAKTDANVDGVRTLARLDRRSGMRLIVKELNMGNCSEENHEHWFNK
jgi:hypothetical protein